NLPGSPRNKVSWGGSSLYSLVPHAATLRTALRAVLVPDGLKNILFFVSVVHPSGTSVEQTYSIGSFGAGLAINKSFVEFCE
ncbi:MAG: hypothetical protein FWH33_00925, partial [Oscillospiraceae bacterium]|nr:hypothetical protein [Oscillospiraceae bacterium]